LLFSPRRVAQRPTAISTFFFFVLFLWISVLLGGCASGPRINNVMLPLTTVKKTVISRLPLGVVREESLNGRELLSTYFNPTNVDEEAADQSERAYAKVLILGSGRPYTVEVRVIREKRRKNNKFEKVGEDSRIGKDLLERIREALAERRDDRNVIDAHKKSFFLGFSSPFSFFSRLFLAFSRCSQKEKC
jgi:hypothetical protein